MRQLAKRVGFALVLIIILLGIGTIYYNLAEGWSYVDSFYFSTMTLTTIGYGDITPGTDAAKIFTSFYALFGIGIMLYILSSVIGVLVFKQEGRFNRFFSSINVFRRQEKELKELKKRVEGTPVKKIEKDIKELKHVTKEIKSLKKRIKNPGKR